MPIDNLPVWSLPPNWDNEVSEVKEWLTEVMESPVGAEQRIPLRPAPRLFYEFATLLGGVERTYMSNLIEAYGNMHFYMPKWHEVGVSTGATSGNILPTDEGADLGLTPGSIVFIQGPSPLDFELAEVQQVTASTVLMADPLAKPRGTGTLFFPVTRVRLTDQPQVSKQSSSLVTASLRFQDMTPRAVPGNSAGIGFTVPNAGALLPRTYLGYPVFRDAPDDSQQIEFSSSFMTKELDTGSAIPLRYDTAGRNFALQAHSWFLQGRGEHRSFSAFLDYLSGRLRPVWVPTFMEDFDVQRNIASGENFFHSENTGFVLSGGPRPSRQDVMIETLTDRHFFRITSASLNPSGKEVIRLSGNFPRAIAASEILRVSFVHLMRANHDQVEIVHRTDTVGVSSAKITFRHTPESRNAPSAF